MVERPIPLKSTDTMANIQFFVKEPDVGFDTCTAVPERIHQRHFPQVVVMRMARNRYDFCSRISSQLGPCEVQTAKLHRFRGIEMWIPEQAGPSNENLEHMEDAAINLSVNENILQIKRETDKATSVVNGIIQSIALNRLLILAGRRLTTRDRLLLCRL